MSKFYGTISVFCLLAAAIAAECGMIITPIVLGILFYLTGRKAAREEGAWR